MNNESRNQRNNVPEAELETGSNKPNRSRRSLTKAGIVAPVIMSLANRPAWGLSPGCQISGFYSAVELESGVAGDTSCGYTSVGGILTYVTNQGLANTKISAIFDCNFNDPTTKNDKVGDILDPTATDNWRKWMVAAYYNAEPTAFNMNPFGTCSVSDVFCHFEHNGPNALFDFGSFQLDESDVLSFLMTVIAP